MSEFVVACFTFAPSQAWPRKVWSFSTTVKIVLEFGKGILSITPCLRNRTWALSQHLILYKLDLKSVWHFSGKVDAFSQPLWARLLNSASLSTPNIHHSVSYYIGFSPSNNSSLVSLLSSYILTRIIPCKIVFSFDYLSRVLLRWQYTCLLIL